MEKITKYIRATTIELKQVSWPTQQQAMLYTALVIGVSVAVSLFVGLFDFIFAKGISTLIGKI